MLPPLAASLGVGLGQAMVFVSLNMLTGAVVLTAAGPALLRRLGARRVALVGAVVSGVALFAVSFVTNLAGLYLLAFASGALATVSMQMTGAALVNDWFAERRGLMQGLLMGVASVGGIAAGAVLPAVVSGGGWRVGFQTVGAVTLVVGTLAAALLIRSRPSDVGLHVYGVLDPDAEAHKDDAGLAPRVALRSPQLAALLLGLVCFSAIMALQQHFPSMMAERGLDLAAAGSLVSLLSVVNVAMTLLLGNLNDRFGPLVSYGLALLLLVGALALFLATAGFPAQAVPVLLFSIPSVTPPILTPIPLRYAFGGRAFVPLLGLATATMPVGIALGSPLWGLSSDVTGSYDTALIVALALTGVIAALVAFALLTGPRRWRGHPQDAIATPMATRGDAVA